MCGWKKKKKENEEMKKKIKMRSIRWNIKKRTESNKGVLKDCVMKIRWTDIKKTEGILSGSLKLNVLFNLIRHEEGFLLCSSPI